MMRRGLLAAYVASDWLAGAASWTVLFVYRKVMFEQADTLDASTIAADGRYQLGLALVPVFSGPRFAHVARAYDHHNANSQKNPQWSMEFSHFGHWRQ